MMSLTVAPTLGPTLGGWITDNYTWNWCFLINVPIGILAMFLVMTFLHDVEAPSKSGRIDWFGIGLLAVGSGNDAVRAGRRASATTGSKIASFRALAVISVGLLL